MATKRAKKKAPSKRWTSRDLRSIKQMVKSGNTGKAIAKALRRTVAALYVKASTEGIALKRKSQTAKTAKKKSSRK